VIPRKNSHNVIINNKASSDIVFDSEAVKNIDYAFIDKISFFNSLKISTRVICNKPVFGIVNHHGLAADLDAEFFASLKNIRPNIKTFVVLSPDHFGVGKRVSYHTQSYLTVDNRLLLFQDNGYWRKSLKDSMFFNGTMSNVFKKEHGVGFLASYIKYYFPKAKIVPIFMQNDVKNRNDYNNLSLLLANNFDFKTDFLLISADMSHYLSFKEAESRDQQTISWLIAHDWDSLSLASDKNTDSAVSFYVLSQFLQKISLDNKLQFILFNHSNSATYSKNTQNTTSYINGFYCLSNE